MFKVECPHCEEEVLLDDRAHGLFDCPHCNNEFSRGRSYRPSIAVTTLLAFSLVFAIGAGLIYYGNSDVEVESEPCENCSWEESLGKGIGQGVAEGAAEAALYDIMKICFTLSGLLLLVAIVTYAIQHFRRAE